VEKTKNIFCLIILIKRKLSIKREDNEDSEGRELIG
jgi:hypothetical protein